jgi:hypothetical protein
LLSSDILSKIYYSFSKKGDVDLTFYEYIIWSMFPGIAMYICGLNPSVHSGIFIITTVFFLIFISPILAYVHTFTWLLVYVRRGKIEKNFFGLGIVEWCIWSFVVPLLFIGFFVYGKISIGYQLLDIWVEFNHLLSRFVVGTVYVVWLIIAPIFGYLGVITRPLAQRKKEKLKVEEEKRKIIENLSKVSHIYQYPPSSSDGNSEVGTIEDKKIEFNENDELFELSLKMKIVLSFLIILACISVALMVGAILNVL